MPLAAAFGFIAHVDPADEFDTAAKHVGVHDDFFFPLVGEHRQDSSARELRKEDARRLPVRVSPNLSEVLGAVLVLGPRHAAAPAFQASPAPDRDRVRRRIPKRSCKRAGDAPYFGHLAEEAGRPEQAEPRPFTDGGHLGLAVDPNWRERQTELVHG